MKSKTNKMLRTVVAWTLALCMVFSTAGMAFATTNVEKVQNELAASSESIQAALDEIYALVEKYDAETLEGMYNDATTGTYEVSEDSYYVALGDSSVSSGRDAYSYKLAETLGLDKDQLSQEGIADLRAEDLRYILDANYTPDAYGEANFAKQAAKLRPILTEEIQKADLITVSFSYNTITKFVAEQTAAAVAGEAAEMDWARYVGAGNVQYVDEALAALEAELVKAGVGEYANVLATTVESYAYACVGYSFNYIEAINAVKAINADALVVLVGMYNPFADAVIAVDEDIEIALGDYVGALVALANAYNTGYAMYTGDVVYVNAPAVEIEKPFAGTVDVKTFVLGLLADGLEDLEASDAGHAYIAGQIANALTVVEEEAPVVPDVPVVDEAVTEAQEAIAAVGAFGAVSADNLAAAKEAAAAARAAYDALTDEQKAAVDADALAAFEAQIAAIEQEIADAEKAAKVEALKNAQTTKATVAFNGAAVKASWAAVDSAKYYTVKLYRNGKVAKTVTKVTGTSYQWKDLARGCYYKASVTPYSELDEAMYAGKAKMSAAKFNKFRTPTTLTVKKANGKVTIKSADRNATGYQIYISKDKKFKKGVKKVKLAANYKALNKKIVLKKNFKQGKNYIKIRPYTTWNGKTYYGKWSKVKTVKR